MRRKTTVWIFQAKIEQTWTWLRKGNLKRETESFLIVAQNEGPIILERKSIIRNRKASGGYEEEEMKRLIKLLAKAAL